VVINFKWGNLAKKTALPHIDQATPAMSLRRAREEGKQSRNQAGHQRDNLPD
jgi:hypothetical protein